MIKKISFLTLCLILMITIFAACTGQGAQTSTTAGSTTAGSTSTESKNTETTNTPKEDIVIAGVYKDMSIAWFQYSSEAAKAKAIAMGAKDFIVVDCQMDPDIYLSAIDNLIAQGIDGVIICIPDQLLSKTTVEKFNAANIPIIADDDPLIDENDNRLAPSFEIDAYAIGYSMGEWLADYAKTNNMLTDLKKCGYLSLTVNTVSSCVPRSVGQRAAWEKILPEFLQSNIIEADFKGETEDAFNLTAAAITANPNIENWFVVSACDEGVQGATRALEQAGLDDTSVGCGLGAYLAKDEFKKEYSMFKAAAFIDPVVDGETCAGAMMDHLLNGTEIFGEYKKDGAKFGTAPLTATIVTADNYEKIMGEQAK